MIIQKTKNLIKKNHNLIREAVRQGDSVIDATIGNGYDTLHLAKCVGSSGKVIGFDVQAQAIQETLQRLWKADIPPSIYDIYQSGHEHMSRHVSGGVSLVVFNLGYLPGSNKNCITKSASTLKALNISLQILQPGGLLSIMCYPGHTGGASEAQAVLDWMQKKQTAFSSLVRYERNTTEKISPFLLIAKIPEGKTNV